MTKQRRVFLIIGLILVVSVLLTACGGVQANNNASTSNMATSTPHQMMDATPTMGGYMTPTIQPTMGMQATPTANGNMTGDNGDMQAFIHTTFVTLNGQKVHVLTNNKGFLLYYYKADTMMTSKCTGACAQNWPPLLAPKGTMTITSSIRLPRKLSVHMTANGNQIFYDGHPLYTYAGDMQAGQFNGRGMGNAWYLVGLTL